MFFFLKIKDICNSWHKNRNDSGLCLFLVGVLREYLPINHMDDEIWEALKCLPVMQIASPLA